MKTRRVCWWTGFLALLLIVSTLTIPAAFAEGGKVYSLKLSYEEGGNLTIGKIYLLEGNSPERLDTAGVYSYTVKSSDGTELYTSGFNLILNYTRLISFDNETGEIVTENVAPSRVYFSLAIPYFENGKVIEFYDPNKKLLFSEEIYYLYEASDEIDNETSITPLIESEKEPVNGLYILLALVITIVLVFVKSRKK
jgi:hypothetical protein